MPITYLTFLISTIAIAGIFPFSGFFSKDEILFHALMDGNVIYWGMGVSGAFITAFYMFRLVFLTFHGESRVDPHVHPHESPAVMTMPLIILAGLALGGGLLGIPLIHDWLEPVISFDWATALHHSETVLASHGHHESFTELLHSKGEHHPNVWIELLLMAFSVAVALSGIYMAYLFYRKHPELPAKFTKGQWGFDLVQEKYRVDELYDEMFVKPTVEASERLWKDADMKGVDGAVNGVAQSIGFMSKIAQYFQSGFVRNYAMFMVMGFVVLLIII